MPLEDEPLLVLVPVVEEVDDDDDDDDDDFSDAAVVKEACERGMGRARLKVKWEISPS